MVWCIQCSVAKLLWCQTSLKTIKHLWICWLVSEICVGNLGTLGNPKNMSSWNISRGDYKWQFLTVSRARIFWLLFWRLLVTGAFDGKPGPIGNPMIMMLGQDIFLVETSGDLCWQARPSWQSEAGWHLTMQPLPFDICPHCSMTYVYSWCHKVLEGLSFIA